MAASYELSRPGLWHGVETDYDRLSVVLGNWLTALLTVALAAVGYGFFVLKCKHLLIYAWTEILFALTSCSAAIIIAKQEHGMGTLTVLGSAVYLTVPGLDNRQKALDDVKRDAALLADHSLSSQSQSSARIRSKTLSSARPLSSPSRILT
jgi:hypothetical protein